MTKYQQLAQDLKTSIADGRWGVGQLLPTESQLCLHYGVSRITVRAAISALSALGLVSKRPGVGTRVVRPASHQRFVHTSDSVESVLQFTEATRFELLQQGLVPGVDPSLVRPDCPSGQPRFWFQGLRCGVQSTLCVADFYVSPLHASLAEVLPGHQGSIVMLMQKLFNVELKEIEQTIEACAISASQAQMLQVRAGTPALVTRRWHRDARGHNLIASISTYPSDRYSYSILLRKNLPAEQDLPPS
jgi:DNA-binding GntR family transcriptional regulator